LRPDLACVPAQARWLACLLVCLLAGLLLHTVVCWIAATSLVCCFWLTAILIGYVAVLFYCLAAVLVL